MLLQLNVSEMVRNINESFKLVCLQKSSNDKDAH